MNFNDCITLWLITAVCKSGIKSPLLVHGKMKKIFKTKIGFNHKIPDSKPPQCDKRIGITYTYRNSLIRHIKRSALEHMAETPAEGFQCCSCLTKTNPKKRLSEVRSSNATKKRDLTSDETLIEVPRSMIRLRRNQKSGVEARLARPWRETWKVYADGSPRTEFWGFSRKSQRNRN